MQTRLLVLLILFWLTTASGAIAQPPVKAPPSTAELKKNLARLEASTEEENADWNNLLVKTTRQLVAYLRTHELSATAAKNLGLDLTVGPKDAASLKVFTFSFSSGGTRGTIDRPVLQWKNAAGQLFAYAPFVECSFYEIHPLLTPGRTLYLLIGSEKGDGLCDTQQAYVIELKGNYLLLDHQALGKSPLLLLCNTQMTFDAAKQTLHVEFEDEETIIDDQLRLTKCGYHRKPGANELLLQFRGGRFWQNH